MPLRRISASSKVKSMKNSQYDKIEAHGCVELGDGVIEPCQGDDKPTIYSIFGHCMEGGMEWISDHRSQESAVMTAKMYCEEWGLEFLDFTGTLPPLTKQEEGGV